MTIRALRARGVFVLAFTFRFRGDALGRASTRPLEPPPRRFPFFLIFRGGNPKLNGGGARERLIYPVYEAFGCNSNSKLSLVHSVIASGRPEPRGVTLGIRLGHFR